MLCLTRVFADPLYPVGWQSKGYICTPIKLYANSQKTVPVIAEKPC